MQEENLSHNWGTDRECYYGALLKFGPEGGAFVNTVFDIRWLSPGPGADAAIAFTLGRMPIRMVARRLAQLLGQLIRVSFGFLGAEDIRGFVGQPIEKTLSRYRPNSVDVPRDQFHAIFLLGNGQVGRIVVDRAKYVVYSAVFESCCIIPHWLDQSNES